MVKETVKMLVYGDPGVGKTVFSCSGDRTIFVDVEGGSLSVQGRIKSKKVAKKRFDTFDEIEDFIRGLREKGSGKAETLVIDSVTELQKMLMDSIVANHPEVKRPYGDGLTVGDWGYNTERMRRFIRMARDLDMNVILTALSMDEKNEITGAVKTMPKMSSKLAADVCGYVDIVGYLYVDSIQDTDDEGNTQSSTMRRMLVQPVGQYYAKDRSGILGNVVDNPTFPAIYKMIFGEE